MRIWLLAAAALVLLCAVIGFTTLTAPAAEAAETVTGSLKVGSNYYSTWEEAVAAAGSSGTIVVTSDFTFPNTATSYQVPAGVTLLLPYDTSKTSVNGASAKHPYANEALVNNITDPGQPLKNVSVTMTIPKGVTLYVYGKVVVGGQIGAFSGTGTLWSGGTSGAHANLQVDGTVDLRNSAILAVTGYVVGSGTIEAKYNNAKIYEPMAVEYRSGHHTVGLADSLNAHSGEGNLCPFFQWSIQNIRTNVVLQGTSSLHVYVDMFANSDHNTTNACFAGSSGAFLNLDSKTLLYSSFDENMKPSSDKAIYTGRKNIRLDGSVTTDSLTLTVAGETIKTSAYCFPIPYNFHVTVDSGTLNVKTKMQLLPGSKLEIKQGAKLNVASELFVYTGANDFTVSAKPTSSAVTITYPTKKDVHLIYPSTEQLQAMEGENGAANLIVDGNMTFSSGGKFAGVVQTNGTGQIDTTNMTAGTLKRSWGGSGKCAPACEDYYFAGETVRTLSPMLYSSGSGTATTMAAGKTYYGTGEADSHTIRTIQYTLYYNSSQANKTYTEDLNAEVAGSWGDTQCTIHLMNGGDEVSTKKVYLMNGADISALGYYSDQSCTSANLVKKYTGQTDLYALYGGTVHTITWKDRNDKVICTTKVMDGALPTYTGPNLDYYVVKNEDNKDIPYGPTGWKEEIVPATADATYTAKYETVQVKVQNPDGRVWYIHDIGYGLENFSNTGNTDETNGALGIVDGSTVTMLTSFSGRINVLSDNLTLDLNGHTFTAEYGPAAILLQQPGIKFTLTDSSTKGGIVLPQVDREDMNHAGIYFNSYNCELLVHQVTIDAHLDPRGVAVYSGKAGNKLTLDDATLIGNIGGVYMDNAFALNITGDDTQIDAIVPIYCALNDYNGYTATLNISGGTFTSTGSGQVSFNDGTVAGPGLPLDDIAGSALVLDYRYQNTLVAISDGKFIAHDSKDPIALVSYKDPNAKTGYAVQTPSNSGPRRFATGGYYSKEINSLFCKRTYSCLLDETVGLYHVYIPKYTITWVYSSTNGITETLKIDENVPQGTLGTDVRYIPDSSSKSQYKNLPTYVGTDKKLYGFTGWKPAITDVYDNATYTTVYEPVDAKVESPDGSVKYIKLDKLQGDISGAGVAAGDTVTLLADIGGRPKINVPITLDLNGHTLTGYAGNVMAVYVDAKTGNNVTITDSAGGGKIVMPECTAEPNNNPYAAIMVVSGNLTLDSVTVEGGTVKYTKNGTTYTEGLYTYTYPAGTTNAGKTETRTFDSYGVYFKNPGNLTLTDATIKGHNAGVYMENQAHGLTIQGNTSIKAAVPIYCKAEYNSTSKSNGTLRIESGTFESTGGNAPYYKSTTTGWSLSDTRLPQNSALVIDYGNTSADHPLDIQISGGTFKGYDTADPIRLVKGYTSAGYSADALVVPSKFVTGGYFSKVINATFFDSGTYVCEKHDVYDLYCLRYPVITWCDDAGNVLHTQEARMGETPVYKGPAEKLQKTLTDGTVQFVTSWRDENNDGIKAVAGSIKYIANFSAAKARVIAPDGSVSYYAKVSNNTASSTNTIDPTAVFSVNKDYVTVKNPAVPDGSTVQLVAHYYGSVRITGKITLDLNGFGILNCDQYAVLAGGGDSENPSEIKIINSRTLSNLSGLLNAKGWRFDTNGVDAPNGNEGVIVVKDYTTVSLEGLNIKTSAAYGGALTKQGIGVLSSGWSSSVTIKDTTITAGSVGVHVSTRAKWTGGEFQGLTIEGENTSISAATPVYFMGKSLNITGGIFTSTGADGKTHSQAYYQARGKSNGYLNAEGAQALPLSALVIDKSLSPTVSISGGTFKGNGGVEPISIVYIGTETPTAPTKFVTGGYFSKAISTDFYDSATYVCEPDASHENLYCLRYPVITWLDKDGNVLHTQEAQMGETPVYKGPAEKLVKDGLYVTSWDNLPKTVSGSVNCTAVYSTAQAKVIAPDKSVSYYKTLTSTGNSDSYDSTAVFSVVSWSTVKNPAVPDGSTIKLLGDCGVTRITGNITFDLNGYNIAAAGAQYAVIAEGSSKEHSTIRIINSGNKGGQILGQGMYAPSKNDNDGVIVLRKNATVTLEGLEIITCKDNKNPQGSIVADGIGIQSNGNGTSRVIIKDTTITAGSVGVYVYSRYAAPFEELTIQGNTSITAATPVYFMGKSLSITGGTFTSTGEDATHSLAYYNPNPGSTDRGYSTFNTKGEAHPNYQQLPLSALVIDKSVSPTVAISGGTFKGNGDVAPISIVWVGTGTEPTAPTDFVTGGYYSQKISQDYYDQNTYSCVTVDNNLYMISAGSVEVTFDLNGHGTSFYKGANDGATIAKPTDPTHPGFTFGGWYKEAACTTEWNFSSDTVTTGITLYAKWTKDSDAVMGTSGDLKSGSTLPLMSGNTVKNNKHLYVAFDVASGLGSGSVRFGHGAAVYGSEYVDLTATTLTVKKYANEETLVGTYTHGLTLSGRVEIQIDVGVGFATITLRCGGKEFQQTNVPWSACNGDIYVTPTGVDLTIADAHWSCDDYDSTIWFFGDSWFSYSVDRWPYYFYQDGYTDYLFSGYPGMNSEAGLASFRQALDYGTPKYAVWCMGMNDADDGAINSSWRTYTDEFLTLCEDRKITPILTTIPSGGRDNSYKNEWIRTNSKVGDVVKFAYVDVERAVISDRSNNTWYDGFADTGMIHPTVEGAKQIYIEIVEKLLDMGALTPSGSGTILKATLKNVSDIWHGNTAYWINAGTGKFYSNAGGTTEIERDSAIVHGGEWKGTEATCTEKGEKTRTCPVCGKKETQIIDALGHAYVAGTPVASTCIKVGFTTYTCSRCDDSYNDFKPLADHDWGENGLCKKCGFSKDAPGISYVSVTMANSLDMNFAFELPEGTRPDGCKVVFTSTTRGAKDQEVPYSKWKTTTINEKQYFYATYTGLAAKEMIDMVYAAVYDSTGKLLCPVRGDCIRDQAMRNLKQTSNELAKKMDVAMLNYGAAAQEKFGYRTNDLANKELTDEQKASGNSLGSSTPINTDNPNIQYLANVKLESNIQFVFALKGLENGMSVDITFTDHYGKAKNATVAFQDFELDSESGYYVYTFEKTVIADARQPITITIKNSEGAKVATITDSIANYAARAEETSEYKELYKCIVKFADAAYAFLHPQQN